MSQESELCADLCDEVRRARIDIDHLLRQQVDADALHAVMLAEIKKLTEEHGEMNTRLSALEAVNIGNLAVQHAWTGNLKRTGAIVGILSGLSVIIAAIRAWWRTK